MMEKYEVIQWEKFRSEEKFPKVPVILKRYGIYSNREDAEEMVRSMVTNCLELDIHVLRFCPEGSFALYDKDETDLEQYHTWWTIEKKNY